MEIVTIADVLEHCKADSDDQSLLEIHAAAAERACAHRCNRKFFATQNALDTAIAALPAAVSAASTAYKTAMGAAAALEEGSDERNFAECAAKNNRTLALLEADAVLGGIVVDKTGKYAHVFTAILITAAHFYKNREPVSTGQGAAAVEIPLSAERICDLAFRISREFVA